MAITKETKSEIIKKFGKTPTDTGMPEVQIALLTARINDLDPAFREIQEGPPLPRGTFENGGKAPPVAGLSSRESNRPVPEDHRRA